MDSNHRRISQSYAYQNGLVELQDAASQQAVQNWPIQKGDRVLDYCAGGGGKSLAIAAFHQAKVTAHDIAPDRMADIPVRAGRAGANISIVKSADLDACGTFDVVICDAPCSGSGTWRRTPAAKWRLTAQDVESYHACQLEILRTAAKFVAPDGYLIYATCSIFDAENDKTVSAILHDTDNFTRYDRALTVPSGDNDGFYFCVLKSKD